MANPKVSIEREHCQTSLSNVEREEVRPKGNPDEYYNRPEVSNSDLTELKNLLHPRMQFGDKEAAFRFGTLVDAIITEPARVNYYQLTVDDVKYTEEELAAMDDTAIAKLDTGSRVMLKANVTILDAMEDVDLPIAI